LKIKNTVKFKKRAAKIEKAEEKKKQHSKFCIHRK
jgi:hypothetical protein